MPFPAQIPPEGLHFHHYPEFGPDADLIAPEELPSWVMEDTADWLAFNKPGWVVCHPSKNGPWSSLVGACREWTHMDTLHLVSRLDRETSGVVLLARHRAAASRLQKALQARQVRKIYLAIVEGTFAETRKVRQPLAKDLDSTVAAKVTVRRSRSARSAETLFRPLAEGGGYSLVQVEPLTGRKHQIRAHARWLGNPVAGDKIYGPDDTLFLEFIEHGWTPRLEAALPLRRQALHAAQMEFADGPSFTAPLAWDMAQFAREVMGLPELPELLPPFSDNEACPSLPA